ncbi:hypothetical protein Fmac_009199 [Flemingia macrophylla]|uniref:RING-type E3 ubiquitin transferase n=1 Tax=Flemingia macrophylla TaxID=520843 RepID=A0ABD1MZM3_9FABA
MANFTSFSSSSSLSHIPPLTPDDSYENSCSICLEPFNIHDPSTVTCCKHEYHLHCILEWSQRSKECPICWQSLALKDPASQELLTAVKNEKCMRSRNMTNSGAPLEQLNDGHDDSCSDDSDSDNHIMRRLVAVASRVRFLRRPERKRSPGGPSGSSEVLGSNSSMHVTGMQTMHLTVPSTNNVQPPALNATTTTTLCEGSLPVTHFQPPALNATLESARRPNTSEMFFFHESIKSKFSSASARCRESISKSTRGLKEKLLAHNVSLKELSKGVRREMNAGITEVSRMIERLELTSKRSSSTQVPRGRTSSLSEKCVEESDFGCSPGKESGGGAVHVSSNFQSFGMKNIPCFKSGHIL